MPSLPSFEPASAAEVLLIHDLAERIWHASYADMLTAPQIRYMLGWMYAPHKLAAEIERGVTYLIVRDGSQAVGYLAWELMNRLAFLNKIYLVPERQGIGWGQVMLGRFLADARHAGALQAELRVNRANARALKAYERAGFEQVGRQVTDIGGGFVMDDFILRRSLVEPGLQFGTDARPSE